jgi:hypothetical protein
MILTLKTGLDRCQNGAEKDHDFVDGMETHIQDLEAESDDELVLSWNCM